MGKSCYVITNTQELCPASYYGDQQHVDKEPLKPDCDLLILWEHGLDGTDFPRYRVDFDIRDGLVSELSHIAGTAALALLFYGQLSRSDCKTQGSRVKALQPISSCMIFGDRGSIGQNQQSDLTIQSRMARSRLKLRYVRKSDLVHCRAAKPTHLTRDKKLGKKAEGLHLGPWFHLWKVKTALAA